MTQKDQDTNILEALQEGLINQRDFLKDLLEASLQKILNASFKAYIGAGKYERTEERQGIGTVPTIVGSKRRRNRSGPESPGHIRQYLSQTCRETIDLILSFHETVRQRKKIN